MSALAGGAPVVTHDPVQTANVTEHGESDLHLPSEEVPLAPSGGHSGVFSISAMMAPACESVAFVDL